MISLGKRLRRNLIDNKNEIPNIIVRCNDFKSIILNSVLTEHEAAMNLTKPVFLSFVVVSTNRVVSEYKRYEKI